MAGAEGIEPSLAALEAAVLPLNYAPIFCLAEARPYGIVLPSSWQFALQ